MNNWLAYLAQRQALYLKYMLDSIVYICLPEPYRDGSCDKFHPGLLAAIPLALVVVLGFPIVSGIASLILIAHSFYNTVYVGWAAACALLCLSTLPGFVWACQHNDTPEGW